MEKTFNGHVETNGKAGVRPGKYLHFKGKHYQVFGLARHVDTLEEFVVYRPLYGDFGLAIRPKAMFLESVTVDGRMVPRFAYVGPMDDEPV